MRKSILVVFTQENKARVGRDVKRLFLKTELFEIHKTA
jgi:hypothetical protein